MSCGEHSYSWLEDHPFRIANPDLATHGTAGYLPKFYAYLRLLYDFFINFQATPLGCSCIELSTYGVHALVSVLHSKASGAIPWLKRS